MPISKELLPHELHYIIDIAERHGTDAPVLEFDPKLGRHVKYAETLAAKDLKALKAVYLEISTRGHASLLNDWYHDAVKNKYPADTTWPIWGLFCLFKQLAQLEIAPFTDGVVQYKERPDILDWSKLPAAFHDLIEPAEKYGEFYGELFVLDYFAEQMTPEEQAELRKLRARLGPDWNAIDHWIDEYPMTEHPESSRVYFLIRFLALGHDSGYL